MPLSESPPPPSAPLSFKTKLGYGLGNFACMVGKQAPKQLSMPIYNVALGVSPGSVGAVLATSRIWDAVIDPFVGHWSDRYQGIRGRRLPFIFWGSILSGLFFASMWLFPRGLSETAYVAYFVVTSFLFYLALTIYSVPWYALGYELAEDYDERTRLMVFPTAIGPVAQILVAWLYAFTQMDFFTDTIDGIRAVGIGAGVILTIFGLMPAFMVKERIVPIQTTRQRAKPPSLMAGMKAAARNRPFRNLTLAFTLILVGVSMVGGLGFYVNSYYVYGGDTKAASILNGWAGTVTQVTTILCTPLAARLACRYGKKEIFQAGIIWSVFRMVLLWFMLDPDHPWLLLVNAFLFGVESASIFMLCHAMIADVCDLDELEHGTRREGLFGAVYAWIFKTGIALSYGISGYLLIGIGFDRSLGGAQSPATLHWMKILYCVVPALSALAALWAMKSYSLNRGRAEEVRAELGRRKAALAKQAT